MTMTESTYEDKADWPDGPWKDEPDRICHVPAPGEPDDVWWFGFDCAHCWDVAPGVLALYARINMARPLVQRDETYRDVAYVRAEVEKLAAQLAGVSA